MSSTKIETTHLALRVCGCQSTRWNGFRVYGVQALALFLWFLCSSFLWNNKAGVGCKDGGGDHCVVCWNAGKVCRQFDQQVRVLHRHAHWKELSRSQAATFYRFPEVIAVSSHRCELAQVVIGAPDVHIFVLRPADYEGVVVTDRTQTHKSGQVFMEQSQYSRGKSKVHERERIWKAEIREHRFF